MLKEAAGESYEESVPAGKCGCRGVEEPGEATLGAVVARSSVLGLIAREGLTFIRFGLSGLPGFVAAVGANILLVEHFRWPKPLAYVLVVWLQMTSGFLMCRFVVFSEGKRVPAARAYVKFALSMGVIRIADWTLYTIAVELLKCPYVVAQISLSALFIGLKFISAKAIFRGRFKLHSTGTQ